MGKHNQRSDYKFKAAAQARAARERAAQKAQKAAEDAPVRPAGTATAPKLNPYERILAKLDADRAQPDKSE